MATTTGSGKSVTTSVCADPSIDTVPSGTDKGAKLNCDASKKTDGIAADGSKSLLAGLVTVMATVMTYVA